MQIQIREQIQRAGCDGKPGNAVPRCFQRVTRRRLGGSACFAGWRLCHTNTRLCWATNTKDIVCVTNATRCWAKYYKMICLSHKHKSEVRGNDFTLGVEELDSSTTDWLSCYKQSPIWVWTKSTTPNYFMALNVYELRRMNHTNAPPTSSKLTHLCAELRCILSVQFTIYFT